MRIFYYCVFFAYSLGLILIFLIYILYIEIALLCIINADLYLNCNVHKIKYPYVCCFSLVISHLSILLSREHCYFLEFSLLIAPF